MTKKAIQADNAPKPIGPYSQAIRSDNTVYLAGVIPIVPESNALVSSDFKAQAEQVMANLQAVCEAAGGSFANIVKLTVYLMDFNHFPILNDIMMQAFTTPYPARTTVQVAKLPKEALLEIDAIMVI